MKGFLTLPFPVSERMSQNWTSAEVSENTAVSEEFAIVIVLYGTDSPGN